MRRTAWVHKPFEEIVWEEGGESYPAFVRTLFRGKRKAMWVQKGTDLHLYINGRASHPMGRGRMVVSVCSNKGIAIGAQIVADMDGYWRPERTWFGAANVFFAWVKGKRKAGRAKSFSYIYEIADKCGRVPEHLR